MMGTEPNKLLEVGAKAPDFTLPDADGNPVSLACVCQRKSRAKGLEKVKHHQHKGI